MNPDTSIRRACTQLSNALRQGLKVSIVLLLKGYQYTLSPLLGNRCRFYPSCSQYAIEALNQRGLLSGSVLAVKRLSRCHPWHPGGVDQLPADKKVVS